jgi:hypothetical protein
MHPRPLLRYSVATSRILGIGAISCAAQYAGQIIRLSIPIATIAISSAIAFTVCWVGLALLGF